MDIAMNLAIRTGYHTHQRWASQRPARASRRAWTPLLRHAGAASAVDRRRDLSRAARCIKRCAGVPTRHGRAAIRLTEKSGRTSMRVIRTITATYFGLWGSRKGASMRTSVWLTALGLVALLGSSAAPAQVCTGDCNGNGSVAINELILGVNISLGNSQISACEAFDANGNGTVTINELIAAVNNSLNGCNPATPTIGPSPTPTVEPSGAVCGNNVEEAGEECDDGNIFGGDDCAANCTTESARRGTFDSTKTIATVQAEGFAVVLNLTGGQTFRTGKPRNEVVVGPGGEVLSQPGDIPVAVRAEELNFDPVVVDGLVCACVRGVPVPDLFGPGISAKGVVGCGPQGLTNVDYLLEQDHITNPGDARNRSTVIPDDPTCDDQKELPGGIISNACLEGDAPCRGVQKITSHVGVCNSPKMITVSGGQVAAGNAFILNNTAIAQLQDAGVCSMRGPRPDGSCAFAAAGYGPDCLPCTEDDTEKGNAENLPTTTGTARAVMYDANLNSSSASEPISIAKGKNCPSTLTDPCVTEVNGSPFSCQDLIDNPTGGLSGGSLAVAFTTVDAFQLLDEVTTTTFFNQ
ncbi:MAG: hypothetical protein ACRERC_15185 [Candidatus Binatia bacterium]